jgi:hypothetical protein
MSLCVFSRYSSHGKSRPAKSESYGNFEDIASLDKADGRTVYVLPDMMSGGDYSNTGLVQKSNYRVFLERFGKLSGVHKVYGGFGTYAIAIRHDLTESNEEIKEVLSKLEDYPLIDEDDHSQLEMEEQGIAWKDWARRDFIRALLELDGIAEKFDEDSLAKILRRKLYKTRRKFDPYETLFYNAAEAINECWEDDGGSMGIHVDKVAESAADTLLMFTTPRKELPLLIGRKWHTKEAERAFEDVMKRQ